MYSLNNGNSISHCSHSISVNYLATSRYYGYISAYFHVMTKQFEATLTYLSSYGFPVNYSSVLTIVKSKYSVDLQGSGFARLDYGRTSLLIWVVYFSSQCLLTMDFTAGIYAKGARTRWQLCNRSFIKPLIMTILVQWMIIQYGQNIMACKW